MAGFVNAKRAIPLVCLQDIPNRIREVALHGARHGAAMALASAQAHSGHELWFLPHGLPAAAHPRDYECLIKDFFCAANPVAFSPRPMT